MSDAGGQADTLLPPQGASPAGEGRASRESMWRNRDFRVFLGGQGISAFGDAISFMAVPLLVLALTGSGAAMGLVGVLQLLPDLLFGLVAGALADRWDRRRLMLYADIGRAALTALIPLAALVGADTMTVILLVTAPINLLRVLFMAGYTAAMPSLVGRDEVGRANGYSEAIFSLSFVAGPAMAGLLVTFIGVAPTLAIDALSFLVSAVALVFVRRPLQMTAERAPRRIASEIAEGVRYIAQERTLRVVVAFWGIVSVVTAPLVPAVIFYLTLDRGQTPETVGIVISAYGVGYLIGAVLAGRLARRRLGSLMLLANALNAAVLAGFAMVDAVPLVVLASLGIGIMGALTLISYITLRATIPPDELLGRVGSTARTVSLGLSPVGLFAGGLLLDTVGGRPTILLMAALAAIASALFAASSHMRRAAAGRHPRPLAAAADAAG